MKRQLTKEMLIEAGQINPHSPDIPDIITKENVIISDTYFSTCIPIYSTAEKFLTEEQFEEFELSWRNSCKNLKDCAHLFFDLFEGKKSFIDKLVEASKK
jgi:hypothetical protein